MARSPRQRVLIEDVPDDDPGTSLPPLPPGFADFQLPVDRAASDNQELPPPADDEGSLADEGAGVGDESQVSVDAILPGTVGGDLATIALEGDILPPDDQPAPGKPRYEQRIRIVEAWQFVEGIARSPSWVDKNWAAWGDEDLLRDIPAGPSIRVPGPGGATICRHGDYIARQMMTLVPGMPPEERIEVWPRESFEKFFIRA